MSRSISPEHFTLPSGRNVTLGLIASPERPWCATACGRYFIVTREKRGDRNALQQYVDPYNRHVVVLEERSDAEAMADALNRRLSTRDRAASWVKRA